MYRPKVEPVTPMMTTAQGLRWNWIVKKTSSIHAGGANTGIVSTASVAKKTRRYIHMDKAGLSWPSQTDRFYLALVQASQKFLPAFSHCPLGAVTLRFSTVRWMNQPAVSCATRSKAHPLLRTDAWRRE